jgi:hypothetical protein
MESGLLPVPQNVIILDSTRPLSLFGGQDDFWLAYQESAGFFDDIRERDWHLIKARIKGTPNCAHECVPQEPATWYQNNWEPAISCQHERRLGLWGEGGKWVCDPHRILRKSIESCLVYSVGSNDEFSFEESILKEISPDCEIHTFDPTVGDSPSNLPTHGKINFHPWGMAGRDQGMYKTLPTIIDELGHKGEEIDIFKIDCEGCELETFRSWFEGPTLIRQILLEVHRGTEGAPSPPIQELMLYLQRKGYVIFYKEPNIQWSGGACLEYAFLRLTPELNSKRFSWQMESK